MSSCHLFPASSLGSYSILMTTSEREVIPALIGCVNKDASLSLMANENKLV